jgi:hypothetical protein
MIRRILGRTDEERRLRLRAYAHLSRQEMDQHPSEAVEQEGRDRDRLARIDNAREHLWKERP